MKRRDRSNQRGLLFLAIALGVVFGVCWILAIGAYEDVLQGAFEERSLAYAQAFAASSLPWIDPFQPAMLEAAARFLLVGSAHYIQLVVSDTVAIEERTVPAMTWELPPVEAPAASSLRKTAFEGSGVLDVTVPLPQNSATPQGYVRIGIDLASVRLRVRSMALWAGIIALGVALALFATFAWIQRSRRTPTTSIQTQIPENECQDIITIGQVEIDSKGRQVLFRGQPVRLTPKQYALLACLAREPGRVYSDREIVQEVWQTSSYADAKDVKQYVYLVRQRLSAIHPEGKTVIETVPGFGYRIPQPIERELTEM